MICNFVTEEVFERDRAGRIWAISGPGEAFLNDLLSHFEEVRIVARVRQVEHPDNKVLIGDPRVSLLALPHYRGPRQLLLRLPRLATAIWRVSRAEGVFLLRVPGTLGGLMAGALRRRRRRFAVQLVGDPRAVIRTLDLSPVLRTLLARTVPATRAVCRNAAVITYVTERTLQLSYPPSPDAICVPFSDIDLPAHWFGEARDAPQARPARLLLCGTLAQLYKGADILIEALALLAREGRDVIAAIAGDGKYRPGLEALAAQRGVTDRIAFLGDLSRDQVARALDDTDIFVMPSRTEGLPRALIEALAKGVPSLASNVGGIPELLDDTELFPVGDAAALAAGIAALIDDPERYRRLSRRGLEVARRYSRDALAARRAEFYQAVRALGA